MFGLGCFFCSFCLFLNHFIEVACKPHHNSHVIFQVDLTRSESDTCPATKPRNQIRLGGSVFHFIKQPWKWSRGACGRTWTGILLGVPQLGRKMAWLCSCSCFQCHSVGMLKNKMRGCTQVFANDSASSWNSLLERNETNLRRNDSWRDSRTHGIQGQPTWMP